MGGEMRVSIIGESVLVEGIVVSLEQNPDITMQRIQADSQDIVRLIAAFQPAVIIYPLGCAKLEAAVSQLRTKPCVRLVGLEIDCNRVFIMDSHVHHSLSLDSFQALIAGRSQELVEPMERTSMVRQTGGLELPAR